VFRLSSTEFFFHHFVSLGTTAIGTTMDDTLKIVVVGNEGVGKSCLIRHLVSSGVFSDSPENPDKSDAPFPSASRQPSAVGLSLHEWTLPQQEGNVDKTEGPLKKIQVWDFEGGQSFHSVQEVFYTPQTLYVVVWDMAAKDIAKMEEERPQERSSRCSDYGASVQSSAFKLGYDSDSDSDDDCDMDLYNQEEVRRSKRALELDIDQKVQFWIDRIEMKVPGATILPVATCADHFVSESQQKEAKKRLKSLKERILWNEERRVHDLERRLKEASEREDNDQDTFHWIKLISNRPNILFRPQEDGQPALPCFVSNVCEVCKSRDRAVEFILASAQALNREQMYRPPQPACARAIQESCRRMKEHFKIVQTNYFAKQFSEQGTVTDDVSKSLELLHNSGEICYFGAMGRFSRGPYHKPAESTSTELADFVVTDPVWLVESLDFILRHACELERMNEEASSNAKSRSLDVGVSNCPSIRKEEFRMLWTNRSQENQGLELAEQISTNALSEVLDFLEKVLVLNDIFVPLVFGHENADSKHFFLPSLLRDRELRAPSESPCCCDRSDLCGQEGPLALADKGDAVSNSLCHSLEFMDSVPATFIERIMVHIIKAVGVGQGCSDKSCTAKKVRLNEFHCSKKSFRIKLGMDLNNGEGEHTVEVHSFIVEAPGVSSEQSGCGGVCQSMCVTCIQGSMDSVSWELWKEICSGIRTSMQRALDEVPGLEYKDKGVCPECLTKKKSVGEVGTWGFEKLRSVLSDGETVIRCRQGHCIDTKVIKGLINCRFDSPDASNICGFNGCGAPPPAKGVAALECVDRAPVGYLCPTQETTSDETDNDLPSTILDYSLIPSVGKNEITAGRRMSSPLVDGRMKFPKPSQKVSRHITHPALSNFSPEDENIKQKLNARMDECEVNMKKRFFARKKNKLDFSNFGLTEGQVPVKDLYRTNLGLHLQSLSLANNRLNRIPEKLVSCLPNLKSLDLSHNSLFELPGRWSLPNLKKLKLSHNLLVSFPSEVRQLVFVDNLFECQC
jgi:GTPase SAR1 family protein